MSNLNILNLNPVEEKIYQTLLVSGQLALGEIQNAVKQPPDTISESIQSLIQKKLVREIPGIPNRYASLLPTGPVKDRLVETVQEIDLLAARLQEQSDQSLASVQVSLQEAAQDVVKNIEQKKQDLEQKISEFLNQLEGELTQLKQQTEQTLADIDAARDTITQETKNSVHTRLNTEIDRILQTQSSKIETWQSEVDELKQLLLSIMTEARTGLPELDLTTLDNLATDAVGIVLQIKEKLKGTISDLHQLYADVSKATSTATENTVSSLSQAAQEFKNELDGGLDQMSTHLVGLASETDQLSTNLTNEIGKIKESGLIPIQSSLQTMLEHFSSFQNTIQETQNLLSQYHEQNRQAYTSAVSKIQDSAREIANTIDQETKQAVELLKSQFQTSIHEQSAHFTRLIEEQLSEIIRQTKQNINQFTQEFTTKLQTMTAELEQKRAEQKQRIESTLSATVDDLSNTLVQTSVSQEDQEKQLLSQFSEKIKQSEHNTSDSLNQTIQTLQELVSQIENHTRDYISQLKQANSSTMNELSQIKEEQGLAYSEKMMNAMQQVTASLGQEIIRLQEHQNAKSEEIVQLIEQAMDNYSSAINLQIAELKQTLDQLYQQSMNNLNSSLDAINEKVSNLIEKGYTINTEHLKEVQEELKTLSAQLQETLSSMVDRLNDQYSQVPEKIKEKNIAFLDSAFQRLSMQGMGAKQTVTEALEQVGAISSANIDAQMDAMRNILSSYQQNFSSTTQQVSSRTADLANLLGSVFQVQETTETPPIKTSYIIGKDAIINQISDIIRRVKSKATILVPSIDMIDESLILGMSSRVQITIISYIDELKHKEWIDRLHNADANVTLRTLITGTHSSDFPDFIGCEREGEEIIIGTIDEGAKDYVAIISASEYFVKIFGNIVISQYSRGVSRQLKK